jgi:hypothetical protein
VYLVVDWLIRPLPGQSSPFSKLPTWHEWNGASFRIILAKSLLPMYFLSTLFKDWGFEKNSENAFFPPNRIEKLMVPSESAPQELSNEWSCQV